MPVSEYALRQFPVRLTEPERAKLDQLAAETGRSRGQIIRILLRKATVNGLVDVEMAPAGFGERQ